MWHMPFNIWYNSISGTGSFSCPGLFARPLLPDPHPVHYTKYLQPTGVILVWTTQVSSGVNWVSPFRKRTTWDHMLLSYLTLRESLLGPTSTRRLMPCPGHSTMTLEPQGLTPCAPGKMSLSAAVYLTKISFHAQMTTIIGKSLLWTAIKF